VDGSDESEDHYLVSFMDFQPICSRTPPALTRISDTNFPLLLECGIMMGKMKTASTEKKPCLNAKTQFKISENFNLLMTYVATILSVCALIPSSSSI
jgi:hypothetical protein